MTNTSDIIINPLNPLPQMPYNLPYKITSKILSLVTSISEAVAGVKSVKSPFPRCAWNVEEAEHWRYSSAKII